MTSLSMHDIRLVRCRNRSFFQFSFIHMLTPDLIYFQFCLLSNMKLLSSRAIASISFFQILKSPHCLNCLLHISSPMYLTKPYFLYFFFLSPVFCIRSFQWISFFQALPYPVIQYPSHSFLNSGFSSIIVTLYLRAFKKTSFRLQELQIVHSILLSHGFLQRVPITLWNYAHNNKQVKSLCHLPLDYLGLTFWILPTPKIISRPF